MTLPSDEAEFAALFERHRRELQVHCYPMLGSLQDAEDLLQGDLPARVAQPSRLRGTLVVSDLAQGLQLAADRRDADGRHRGSGGAGPAPPRGTA
jgi:hypothetical protein